jgi:hypothetical protein
MAINEKQIEKIGLFGGITGLATPLLLDKVIMPVLNFFGGFVPEVSLKLASTAPGVISVNVRESLTGVNTGLAGWLVDALGLTISVPNMTYIMAVLGGALFMILGAMLADRVGFLKGDSESKTRTTIFTGSILAAILIGWNAATIPTLGISMLNVIIAFAVNAAILAYGYVKLDKFFKIGLNPF